MWQHLKILKEKYIKDKNGNGKKTGIYFDELIEDINKVLPFNTKRNINKGSYFTCILHIANDKSKYFLLKFF
jgi:hypothetical protein